MVDRPAGALVPIAAEPRWVWLLPVVVAVVLAVAAIVLTFPLTSDSSLAALDQQLAALPSQQAEMVNARVAWLRQPSVWLGAGIASRLLWMFVSWLFSAVVLYLCMLLGGADVSFGGLFAAVPWTWLPFALRDVVQTAYVLLRGRLIANQGLSYFVSTGIPAEDATSLSYGLLAQVDLFALWHAVLVLVLLSAVPRFSRGKAFVLTAVYCALNLGLRLLPALLGRTFVLG